MRSQFVLGLGLAACMLAGCSQETMQVSSRSFSSPEAEIAYQSQAEAHLAAQARTLEDLTSDIIRKSTLQGAGMGAVAGCAVAAISASGAQACVAGALAGGAIGGVMGKQAGERKVAKRMQLVQRDDLAQSLSRASARLGSVKAGLRDVLAAQQAERTRLDAKLAAGVITQERYDARIAAMSATRANVAEALMLTAGQARDAQKSLRQAKAQGQTDIDWHLQAAEDLESEAISARSGISML